jgi:outer membrane receptor protein involved in Fe transport
MPMSNFTTKLSVSVFMMTLLVSLISFQAFAQTVIKGTIIDAETKETLVGVNIVVKGKVIGTITDLSGNFSLNVNQAPPLSLVFSMVGYAPQEIEITNANTSNLQIALSEQTMLGQEVVVSASRVEESILKSPVSIEKMDILAIRDTPADTYYKGIANLKGVDVSTSSINFQIINARGFNSTGNTRFVQLTDGMDTQAPALNFPIGNLNGPSELDVESVEFIPGASSALYGPNAFNGILLVNSKSPFEYQGLSAFYKQGVNHINGQAGEPTSPKPMYEGSIRYAKAFNNKFAFKINASYMQATDWHGINQTDLNREGQGNLPFNPGQTKFMHLAMKYPITLAF